MSARRLTSPLLFAALFAVGCDSDNPVPFADAYKPGVGQDGGLANDARVCGNITRIPELPPFDVLLALDTSYSMDFKEKWLSVKSALKVFATDKSFSSMGVGVQYFPLRAQCKVADYAAPAVPVANITDVSSTLVASLDEQRMAGGTPMVPMLTGLLEYARKWAEEHPERNISIIIATDGIPDDTCIAPSDDAMPNTLANIVKVAAEAAMTRPRIPIFVIGVGGELTALNEISQAGGTGDAFLVDTAENIQKAFLEALNDIRRTMACAYDIPDPPSEELILDFAAAQVRFTINDEDPEYFENVLGEAGCAGAPDTGWYYDDVDEPRKIILCKDACKKSHSDGGKIEVIFGCQARPF
ncbi:MAG: VWA domain-containing protein [Deltaproteobacteria bacterium]|nr:VWA domain-containing protein [Deltaproteobacteria bacterium]